MNLLHLRVGQRLEKSREEIYPTFWDWYFSQSLYNFNLVGDLLIGHCQGYAGRRLNGGTTIAGTMVLARLAGIKVFATGGLGGVHRGGENSMDISADLTELGRTNMAVIAGGCKSFLDIPRTLEYLETQGVTVGTFSDGREGHVDFPAFWTRDSGNLSPLTIKDEEEAAQIISKWPVLEQLIVATIFSLSLKR